MKNYKQTASDVLRLVGGEKNVVQVEHCSTRLRFTLADTSKVDAAALKKTAGVMGVISSGPQCQVVIGNDVIEVYDELLKLGTFNAGQAAAPAAPKGKKEIGGIILDYMVGIFQPLVPAIAGAGVLKALMVLLSTLGLMSSGDIAYKVFVGVADAALYYLPVMVAFTTATKFNCNKLVSVALAAAMIHPSVSALLATMLANGKQTADAGMQIEQTTMTFSELLNWIYRDTSVGDQYGVFTYGMFNLATGFADVYDYAYNFASDPESDYVKMGYNQNYIFDKELDDLSMDMVYKSAPGDDATYLDYFQKFIVRWNALLPEIPLYCNDYHTFFPSWLKNYNESSLWDFQKAIVYASIEGAE